MKLKKTPIPRSSYVNKLKEVCLKRKLKVVGEITYAHIIHRFQCSSGHIFERKPKSLLNSTTDIICDYCKDNIPHNKKYTKEFVLKSIKTVSLDLGFIPSPSELREINMDDFNGGSVYSLLSTKYEKEIVPILRQETNLDYGSKYFFIDGNRFKSRIEVFFVNFFMKHNINFDYEPTKFYFNSFSKIPDFKIGGKYYDIAGYHSERYENKLVDSLIQFNKKNIPYEVIKVKLEDLFSIDFYYQICKEFNVTPLYQSGIEVYKKLMVWDKSKYDKDVNELKNLLSRINNFGYKSDEYKKINFLIKSLGLKNIGIACEYFNISFQGKRIIKNRQGQTFSTPTCINDGTLKKYLEKNPKMSIREIERLGLFNISRKTLSKYRKEWELTQ